MKHQKLINSGTPALVNNSTFIILLFAASGVFPIQAVRNSLLLQAPHSSLSSQAAEEFRTKGSHAAPLFSRLLSAAPDILYQVLSLLISLEDSALSLRQ